jgi:HlyD family secretion protein
MKKLFLLVFVLAVGALGALMWTGGASFGQDTAVYRTTKVERSDLRATVSATGTIEPEEVVDVGAQVAGKIISLGKDLDHPDKTINYCSRVRGPRLKLTDKSIQALRTARVPEEVLAKIGPMKNKDLSPQEFQAQLGRALGKVELGRFQDRVVNQAEPLPGDLLALIDDSVYKAKVTQAEANLAQAEANVDQQVAKLRQFEREWKRSQTLFGKGVMAESDYDAARSNYETTKASVEVNQATVKVCKAALEEAQTNLGYTKIVSPVDGVIIDRRVNIGQTVVASLNAPSLFLIAKDLRRVEIWASVNEADIGQVQKAKQVTFTVAPDPKTELKGKVSQVRLNALMNSGVVTYTVVVSFDNTEARLLPYLTASLKFEYAEAKGVKTLPNAALRYRPQIRLLAPEVRDEWAPKIKRRKEEGEKAAQRVNRDGREFLTVWLQDGKGFVVPREIEVGLSDGVNTEIKAGLEDGDEVVTGVERVIQSTQGIFTRALGGKGKEGSR